jgi:putative oxidoreductase
VNPKLLSSIQTGGRRLATAAGYLQSPFLLLLRLYWGWSFFQTGKGKLFNHPQTAEFFASLNLPLAGLSAWMAGATECFGGLLLLVGLASRLTCIPLIFIMIVAYLTAENEALRAIFSDPDKFTSATPFLFLLTAVIVLIFGPGRFSLDTLIEKKWTSSETSTRP